ncbi:MAG: hypothetical protein M1835_002144 [Candelina submexicana]|nr:MAG: hypothetical protein M1835_002144 [Candelina submexicana]
MNSGFLFFLRTGIIFAFKKPLLFFAFDTIDSISYISVLQRTFNLNITTSHSPTTTTTKDFEFSMLDQADFGGIDEYIKRHGLHDASMAEQRRAKKVNVNGIKGEESDAVGEQEGELEKARREAEDLEDELEQDYDPGSEGQSEGEGTSDEESD